MEIRTFSHQHLSTFEFLNHYQYIKCLKDQQFLKNIICNEKHFYIKTTNSVAHVSAYKTSSLIPYTDIFFQFTKNARFIVERNDILNVFCESLYFQDKAIIDWIAQKHFPSRQK